MTLYGKRDLIGGPGDRTTRVIGNTSGYARNVAQHSWSHWKLANKMLNTLPKILLLLAVPLMAQAPAPIGELFASEATPQGPALLAGAGMSVVSGSQLSAGKAAATLRLARGGEVKICPQSSLAVNTTGGNESLMF